MGLEIRNLFVEDQIRPLGMDEEKPRFSWILSSDQNDTVQTAINLRVGTKRGEKDMWEHEAKTEVSQNYPYEGKALCACTRYFVSLIVTDCHGRRAEAETWFETGLMNPGEEAWENARWIAAPYQGVEPCTRGVFSIEAAFCLEGGRGRAGLVFGAGDSRLQDPWKNEYHLCGENYIRYEVEVLEEESYLHIYRVGYSVEDRPDVPFYSGRLGAFSAGTADAALQHRLRVDASIQHRLRVDVEGNHAFAYMDGCLVDAVMKQDFTGESVTGRCLNPRGFNDVITYPRLNEIGFFAGEGSTVLFQELTVRNLREPAAVVIRERPEGNLYGEPSAFAGRIPVCGDSFVLSGKQVTADTKRGALPMFRRTMKLRKDSPIKAARLYLTARGIYECRVNGQKTGDQLLPPGLTQYDKRMNYQTYDLTELLHPGENAMSVILSSGWWSDAQTFVVKNYNYFGDKEAFLAMLKVTYENNESDTFVSNEKEWICYGDGPYRYASFFQGEIYDARGRKLYEEFSCPEFQENADYIKKRYGWESRLSGGGFSRPVTDTPVPVPETRTMPKGFGRSWPAVHETKPVLEGGYDAPVIIVSERISRGRKEVRPGVWLYDLEQEMAGVMRITFREQPGTRVTIRCGEMLYPELPEYGALCGEVLFENYRDASSTDQYICSGQEGGEIYQPRFTVHGFRYLEISGCENPPLPEEVAGLQYSSVSEMEGSFSSSDPVLDRFAENVRWSQLCNFINIPTDCPQRNERMGWAGDTHVFCHTALQNSRLKLFYERNLKAMRDLQTKEGQYPEIAPVGGGFGGITYECASIFMTWELYLQYGDRRTVENNYPGMKFYMDYMKEKGLPGKGDFSAIGPLGDWLAPEETDLPLLFNAFYYREAVLMSRMAGLLEIEEDEAYFANLAERIKTKWNSLFVEPESGKTRSYDGSLCDTQCSYALALVYGVSADRETMGRQLARKTRELSHTVGTGFFGTGLLNRALTEAGYVEDAYKLMLSREYPSWLYPVTQGATTIWERWNSYTREKGFGGLSAMNSFNHYSLGSVLSWMYEHILGIQRLEEYPGYKHFLLMPKPMFLSRARGSISTPYGSIESGWQIKEGMLHYDCSIPVNTTALLVLPDGKKQLLGSGKYQLSCEA